MERRKYLIWMVFIGLLVLTGLWSLSALAGCSSTVNSELSVVSTTTTTTTLTNITTTTNLATSTTTTTISTTTTLPGLSGTVALNWETGERFGNLLIGVWNAETSINQSPQFFYVMPGITSTDNDFSYQFAPSDLTSLSAGNYYIAAYLHMNDKGDPHGGFVANAGDRVGQYDDGGLPIVFGGSTHARSIYYDGNSSITDINFSINGKLTTGTTVTLVTTTTMTSATTTTTMIPPGGAFSLYSIDNNEDVINAALALDDSNYAHVSYYDATHKTLRYAENVAGSWSNGVVDSGSSDIGKQNAIAVAPNGTVYISYCDSANGRLKVASRPYGGSWSIETIEDTATSNGIEGNSIAADANNKVHISYYHQAAKSLKYANNLSGGWVITTIEAGGVGDGNSIALDRVTTGRVHIAYNTNTPPHVFVLKYMTNRSGSWSTPVVVDNNNCAMNGSNSLAIDSMDNVQIIYSSPYAIELATNATGSWVKSELAGYLFGSEKIAIDSNDHEHVCYSNSWNSAISYATNASGTWECYAIESPGYSYGIAIDKNNKPHIIYTLTDSGAGHQYLKYATNK